MTDEEREEIRVRTLERIAPTPTQYYSTQLYGLKMLKASERASLFVTYPT